jgi:ankyrin repeat protein
MNTQKSFGKMLASDTPEVFIEQHMRIEQATSSLRKLTRQRNELAQDVTARFERQSDSDFGKLLRYIKLGNAERIGELFKEKPELNKMLHRCDGVGMTPLHWAVKRGHDDIIKMLMEKGGNPDIADLLTRTSYGVAKKSGKFFFLNSIPRGPRAAQKSFIRKTTKET